ncbi:MAG: type II toxin-antitoxin system Phd/YefM family antitoxin, partial [Rothia aeria]
MTTTVSAREFNQNASAALRLAAEEPVFITKRGTPTNVILSIEDYQRLTQPQPRRSLADARSTMSAEAGEIEFEIDREPSTPNP